MMNQTCHGEEENQMTMTTSKNFDSSNIEYEKECHWIPEQVTTDSETAAILCQNCANQTEINTQILHISTYTHTPTHIK